MASSTQRSWYRLETPDAPQGHALAHDWGKSTFVGFEQTDGSWIVWRIDDSGFESERAVVPSFSEVRRSVGDAISTYSALEGNPYDPEKHGRYVSAGAGALAGTVVGMLLGGLPGILANHTALASVGSHVGGVVGAAVGAGMGATVGHPRKSNPTTHLKKRLLR